ncbi:hypothetical protein MKX01_033059 [Papaver californicum]|nr:hypothetical protein MKX01_033059 [Papaver californicum]
MDYKVEVVMQNIRAREVDDISNSISSLFLDFRRCDDDVIVYEILSRRTVKALMRFKCVSKRWHTREVTPWIKSTLLIDEQEKNPGFDLYVDRNCSFGFDPITMEHKIISMSFVSMEEYDGDGEGGKDIAVCEVLTVGENTWRRIDEVPPVYEFGKQEWATCINGSIYWMTDYLFLGDWRKDKDLGHIVAFDIGSEKFRTISLPNCIVDKLPNPKCYIHALDRFFVLEVDGRVAFLRRINPQFVHIRIFNEESSLYSKERGNKITINPGEKSWTEDTIKLPFNWDRKEQRVEIYGVAGTDQIIIEFYGDPSLVPEDCYTKLFIPFVESIIPVRKEITKRKTKELDSDSMRTENTKILK